MKTANSIEGNYTKLFPGYFWSSFNIEDCDAWMNGFII